MFQKTLLDNGLRVVSINMPHTRSVSICIFVGAGLRYENDAENGVSHFIEHLLFRGTPKRPTGQLIAEAIEGIGGIINAATDRELTCYWCKVPENHFNQALDVLADILLNANFVPADIERERQVIIEEINMSMDAPSQRVHMLIDDLIWANHPLGRDVAGTRKTVSGISREMMLSYRKLFYQPANTVIAVAGNIEHPQVLTAVNKLMGNWKGVFSAKPIAKEFRQNGKQHIKIENRDISEANLCLALPGLSLFNPRRFTMDILSIVLGGGMSSRLFTEIRDKLGLVYSINCYAEHVLDSGSLIISAGVEPKNLNAVITAILQQLAGMKTIVPEAELAKAKEIIKGPMLMQMENSRTTASWVAAQELLAKRVLTVDEVIQQVEAVTAEDIRQMANEYLLSERLNLAVVGPVAQDEPLEKLLHIA